MKFKVSFDRAVYFTKLSVGLAGTWPPPRSANKWQIIKHDITWALLFINVSCLVSSLLVGTYVHSSNPVAVTQSTCFACGGLNYIIKSLLYRARRKRMQIMMGEMENFCNNARSHERNVLQTYVNGCSGFHVFITAMNYLTAIGMAVGPLIFHQPLHNFAVYPFAIDSGNARYLIYVHQIIAFLQYSAGVSTDCHIAMIMWYASARLEILANEISHLSNVIECRDFIEKHQRLLTYAFEVADTMCYAAFVSMMACGSATVLACMQVVDNQPLRMKVQYGPVILISTANLFVSAWPAENLLRSCELVSTAVYNTTWVDVPAKLRKDLLIILQRSQTPVKISIGGFIPTLSLRFYASYLSAAFSYFTALRVAILADREK